MNVVKEKVDIKIMKRNLLSVRQTYFRRRGIIDEKEISSFITAMVSAINKYGWAMVFNMNKTSVRNNNGSNKTLPQLELKKSLFLTIRMKRKSVIGL